MASARPQQRKRNITCVLLLFFGFASRTYSANRQDRHFDWVPRRPTILTDPASLSGLFWALVMLSYPYSIEPVMVQTSIDGNASTIPFQAQQPTRAEVAIGYASLDFTHNTFWKTELLQHYAFALLTTEYVLSMRLFAWNSPRGRKYRRFVLFFEGASFHVADLVLLFACCAPAGNFIIDSNGP